MDYAFQEPEYYYINKDEYDILVTEESKTEFFKLFALNLVETLCEISNNGTLVALIDKYSDQTQQNDGVVKNAAKLNLNEAFQSEEELTIDPYVILRWLADRRYIKSYLRGITYIPEFDGKESLFSATGEGKKNSKGGHDGG